jgi:hypothetical protein
MVNPPRMEAAFSAGVEDVIIFPLVTTALVLKSLAKRAVSVLVHILDYAFLLAMELARFPLFAVRALGDGVIGALRGLLGYLPLAQETRQQWRDFIGHKWARIRRAISYRAFEQAVHHVFERGMDWVFKKCRTLSPHTAFYVIIAAILWLPISVGVATAMHALLLANASSLPAWMQLLHPFATVVAKSKLLVLPVYPAAWPQAKKHPLIQTIARAYRNFESLFLIQKVEHRYRQTEHAMDRFVDEMRRFADLVGLSYVGSALWSSLCGITIRIAGAFRYGLKNISDQLSAAWLIGPVVRTYMAHLNAMERRNEKISEKVKRGFERWFVRFSAEYYEAKEAEKAAKAASEKMPAIRSASEPAMLPLNRSGTIPPAAPIA